MSEMREKYGRALSRFLSLHFLESLTKKRTLIVLKKKEKKRIRPYGDGFLAKSEKRCFIL